MTYVTLLAIAVGLALGNYFAAATTELALERTFFQVVALGAVALALFLQSFTRS